MSQSHPRKGAVVWGSSGASARARACPLLPMRFRAASRRHAERPAALGRRVGPVQNSICLHWGAPIGCYLGFPSNPHQLQRRRQPFGVNVFCGRRSLAGPVCCLLKLFHKKSMLSCWHLAKHVKCASTACMSNKSVRASKGGGCRPFLNVHHNLMLYTVN